MSQTVSDHFVFSSLPDPADVVVVLLPDMISHGGTNVLENSSSNVICYSEILWVTRCAHPAKWAKAQRKNVPVRKTKQTNKKKILVVGMIFQALLKILKF